MLRDCKKCNHSEAVVGIKTGALGGSSIPSFVTADASPRKKSQ